VRPALFTVDVEPDCPPYLWTFRGMEEGMPRLLDLMGAHGVRGTFFTTADVARRYPLIVQRVVDDGHELASHGVSHRAFDTMTRVEAEREIADSVRVLRAFAPVTAFRAPYLRMPEAFVPMLADHGITVDCSVAKYKRRVGTGAAASPVRRIPASVTSSILRAPDVLRWPYMRATGWPLVLFVHPWEFVDLRRTKLRWDCRFRTGDTALSCLGEVFAWVNARGGRFTTVRES
jgi:peptidoglycan/xylan/chitin deacetylase (PgdA/CDA1 family)